MKKTFITFSLVLGIFFISCEKIVENRELDLKDLQVDFSGLKIMSNPNLLEYNDVPSLLDSLDRVMDFIVKDVNEEKSENPTVTDVLVYLRFHDGAMSMQEAYLLNVSDKQVLRGMTYNSVDKAYEEVDTFAAWDKLISQTAADSREDKLIRCSNDTQVSNCLAYGLKQYLSSQLTYSELNVLLHIGQNYSMIVLN